MTQFTFLELRENISRIFFSPSPMIETDILDEEILSSINKHGFLVFFKLCNLDESQIIVYRQIHSKRNLGKPATMVPVMIRCCSHKRISIRSYIYICMHTPHSFIHFFFFYIIVNIYYNRRMSDSRTESILLYTHTYVTYIYFKGEILNSLNH